VNAELENTTEETNFFMLIQVGALLKIRTKKTVQNVGKGIDL
jgi:hypothetical protein